MDAPAPPRRTRRSLRIAFAAIVAGGFATLLVWMALSFSYGTGERVGYVQKFSRKGWVCKTWEGELAIQTMPGVLPEKFYFSTRSEPIAERVNSNLGKLVRVKYDQHKFVPSSCFGDTEYFVAEVQLLE